MPISFAEPLELDCPNCGTRFRATTWMLIDGHERPDLVKRILDGTLHDVACSNCALTGEVPAPVLYHDGQAQRVLLGVPSGMPEEGWRAAGQSLLWALIGELPDERRDPYLGEVQAEAGLAGLATVIRAENLAGLEDLNEDVELPPLVTAIQALLNASGPDSLQHVFQRHPILIDPQTVTILRELAHAAFKQDEPEAGEGFSRAADILNEFRTTHPDFVLRAATTSAVDGQTAPVQEDPLGELAFALLRSHTGEMLAATVDTYPHLLDAKMDEELGAWEERARAEGKSRIADGIAERRQALREMRAQYEQERPVFEAVQALLDAESPEQLEGVLLNYDALYSDAAAAILQRLEKTDDAELDLLIRERSALVSRIRTALAAQEDDQREA